MGGAAVLGEAVNEGAVLGGGTASFFVFTGGGPTPFLYMATRFLPNVHVQKCTKMYKICFFL